MRSAIRTPGAMDGPALGWAAPVRQGCGPSSVAVSSWGSLYCAAWARSSADLNMCLKTLAREFACRKFDIALSWARLPDLVRDAAHLGVRHKHVGNQVAAFIA